MSNTKVSRQTANAVHDAVANYFGVETGPVRDGKVDLYDHTHEDTSPGTWAVIGSLGDYDGGWPWHFTQTPAAAELRETHGVLLEAINYSALGVYPA